MIKAEDIKPCGGVSTVVIVAEGAGDGTADSAAVVTAIEEDPEAVRTALELGTMATQAASEVAITGGTIAGITDLAVADGGTGASTAADARANLGFGDQSGGLWFGSSSSAAGVQYYGDGGPSVLRGAYSGVVRSSISFGDGGGWDAALRSHGGNGSIYLMPNGTGDVFFYGPAVLTSYTVGTVPAAASHTRGMIWVSNETGGATPAFSDGTDWRRVSDRAIIS